ncbi:uncharacterized protein LOC119742948 [Patiria miniata]|uniref:Uncharacterized protein n=1 Tax=Patiria miniata TaxID=46514 RepID=A0A914BFX5_PATMI|nr:uncharacterized protein LOC119742948 [Patiria miniata]
MMTPTNAPPAYVAAPQQVVTVQPAPQRRSGNWTGIQWTGIFQVGLGSLTAILGIVTLAVFKRPLNVDDIGSPIWCGICFYVFAGIFGIVSGSKKNSEVAVGYMVMSILACLATCCVICFAVIWMLFVYSVCTFNSPRYYDYGSYHHYYYPDVPVGCYLQNAVYGVYASLILLALAEFVVAIVGASLTCGPLCSGGSATQTVIHYQARPRVVVATQPLGTAFYNIPAGQPQVVCPAQQGQYPQAQAPPTGEQQYQELMK